VIGTHHKGISLLTWALLIVAAFCFAAAAFVRNRRQHLVRHDLQFQVAPAEQGIGTLAPQQPRNLSPRGQLMTLDPSGKFLVSTVSNKPVFITGDDAWSLLLQLSDQDISYYLDDRASRGFNSLWVALVDNTYSNQPPLDFYGNSPFNGPDFTNENPIYWARVDRILQEAAARGIAVFASPAFVGAECKGGYCWSYRSSSLEVIVAYGEFLGKRYRGFPNIVWLIGGDANPLDADVQLKLHGLARAIRSADPIHLITTENDRGNSSIDIWSQASWLDLDALYVHPEEIAAKSEWDYHIGSHPVFLFEDWYEGAPGLDDRGIREEGYEAVLNGCVLGRLFGNVAIWNFNWPSQPSPPWKSQLNSPGSVGQMWLGRLFRSREYWKLIPDTTHRVLIGGYDSRSWFITAKESLRSFLYQVPYRVQSGSPAAARTSDGQTIIAYLPKGNATTITIEMDQIRDRGSRARAWWFNPRDGSSQSPGIFATSGSRKFIAPDSQDWVLVIDSLDASLPAPGERDLER
jgi:hypothetical protein